MAKFLCVTNVTGLLLALQVCPEFLNTDVFRNAKFDGRLFQTKSLSRLSH